MHRRKWQTCVTSVLIGTAVISGFFCGKGTVFCEAKAADAEKEVTEFVTAYYEAQTPEGMETLPDYVSEPEDVNFQMSLISLQTLFENGFTEQVNIRAAAYPMSDGAHWVVPVSREWVVRDLDVTLPGMNVLLVGRKQDGGLQIESYEDYGWDNAFLEEMREITLLDEIVDWNIEIAAQYNEVIADYPDVAEWILDVSNETEEAQAEAAQRMIDERENVNKEKSDAHENRYIVKKGDCLWSIAEEKLGNGMRWGELYETNRAVVGENPDLLYVGIELRLP